MSYVKVPVKMKEKKAKKEKPVKKDAADNTVSAEESVSELQQSRWSVVTFETCAASHLTYDEAARKLAELQAEKVSGLCIITDEAAEKLQSKT